MHVIKRFAGPKDWTPGRHAVFKNIEEEHREAKRKLGHIEPPLCVNQDCREKGGRHHMNRCRISTAEKSSTLLEDYRKDKKAQVDSLKSRDGKVDQVTQSISSPRSALFRGTFANEEIERDLRANQGADANVIDDKLLTQIFKGKPNLIS